MPCAAPARGTRAGVPNPPGHLPPFNDATDNNPCGKPILASVAGVDVSAENLCRFHWGQKHGLADVKGILVNGP